VRAEEQELIGLLRNGDAAAFRALVDQYKDKVYNSALGILQDEDDAADITQEVFITVFRSISTFKGESSLSTWIYRITVTRSLDHLRTLKRKKRWGTVKRIFGRGDESENIPVFHHPGIQLENKEKAALLFKAIARLPGNQRAAFTLHHLEGLSHKEIAEALNVTVGSVESLLHRAKQNLRKILGGYYKNE
jgi:RNA polymerase sigma-70 factor (ECF subfamily)